MTERSTCVCGCINGKGHKEFWTTERREQVYALHEKDLPVFPRKECTVIITEVVQHPNPDLYSSLVWTRYYLPHYICGDVLQVNWGKPELQDIKEDFFQQGKRKETR